MKEFDHMKWEQTRTELMRDILTAKFTQVELVRRYLIIRGEGGHSETKALTPSMMMVEWRHLLSYDKTYSLSF